MAYIVMACEILMSSKQRKAVGLLPDHLLDVPPCGIVRFDELDLHGIDFAKGHTLDQECVHLLPNIYVIDYK